MTVIHHADAIAEIIQEWISLFRKVFAPECVKRYSNTRWHSLIPDFSRFLVARRLARFDPWVHNMFVCAAFVSSRVGGVPRRGTSGKWRLDFLHLKPFHCEGLFCATYTWTIRRRGWKNAREKAITTTKIIIILIVITEWNVWKAEDHCDDEKR